MVAAVKARPGIVELALAELGRGEVGQVIRDLIGDASGLDQVVAHVAERSDGNPFFAEELILSLAQSGVLVGERGHYRLAPSGWQNPTLPTTVEAVIGARIDLLPTPKRRCCRPLRSSERSFRSRWFAAVAGLSDAAARPLLRRLRAAELIQPRQTAMGESFAFRHPLIQEVAYAMQLRSTRTSLHAAVAKAIEAQEWGRRDEFAGLVAHHYEAAGQDGCRGDASAAFGALGRADKLGTSVGGLEENPHDDAGSAAVQGKR